MRACVCGCVYMCVCVHVCVRGACSAQRVRVKKKGHTLVHRHAHAHELKTTSRRQGSAEGTGPSHTQHWWGPAPSHKCLCASVNERENEGAGHVRRMLDCRRQVRHGYAFRCNRPLLDGRSLVAAAHQDHDDAKHAQHAARDDNGHQHHCRRPGILWRSVIILAGASPACAGCSTRALAARWRARRSVCASTSHGRGRGRASLRGCSGAAASEVCWRCHPRTASRGRWRSDGFTSLVRADIGVQCAWRNKSNQRGAQHDAVLAAKRAHMSAHTGTTNHTRPKFTEGAAAAAMPWDLCVAAAQQRHAA